MSTFRISNGYYIDGIVAVQLETFIPSQGSIKTLQKFAQQGLLVQVHTGYKQNGADNYCQNITNSLAGISYIFC